jgi:hypothetical protein
MLEQRTRSTRKKVYELLGCPAKEYIYICIFIYTYVYVFFLETMYMCMYDERDRVN